MERDHSSWRLTVRVVVFDESENRATITSSSSGHSRGIRL